MVCLWGTSQSEVSRGGRFLEGAGALEARLRRRTSRERSLIQNGLSSVVPVSRPSCARAKEARVDSFVFLGLTPPAGCAVWDQIWEREDLIAFASSYHDSMLGLC